MVFLVVVTSVVLLVAVLIPALAQVAQQIGGQIPSWVDSINATFHVHIGGNTTRSTQDLEAAARAWLADNGQAVLGIASTSVGVVFQFLTTAMFTFYFAADAPKIRRALLVRLPPERQARIGWAWDTAIQQTGGYFYSRLVLLVINAGLFFFVMVAVGTPWLVALPLAVFQGFFAEFIPIVGTYVGTAVPVVVVLGFQGVWPALVLVGWTLLYQQMENYWLSPRLSARTMEINGGVAFGSALAGGAIGGPLGAFMAMPVAALITSFVKHYGRRYPLTYQSAYDHGRSAETMAEPTGAVERPATPMSVDLAGPATRRPQGLLSRQFSQVGLVVGAFFFSLSLFPSLLPRAGWAQGVVSGVTFAIGYGLGTGASGLWRYLQCPRCQPVLVA